VARHDHGTTCHIGGEVKVARLHGIGDLRVHEEAIPIPKPEEARLHVQAVGICGSDLHWLKEAGIGDAQLVHPLVLGHEFAATTDAGERVAADPSISCGQCEMCQHGNPNLCNRIVVAGHGDQDGAMREVMVWPSKCLYRLPDSLSFADGAMLEPLGIAIHAVDLAKLKTGMTVGVFGCGPIGLLILQVARLAGASSVIATDKLAHRVLAAKELGAVHALTAKDGTDIEEIRSVTNGRGVDVAFEVAGEQDAVETTFSGAAIGSKVILVGIPADDRTAFQASVARRKGLTIKLVRRMKHTYPRAIRMVEEGNIDVRSLVTHRFPLQRAAEAFAVAERREGLKVIIEPGAEAL
jgi:L-iditol 2-dehydrogenase